MDSLKREHVLCWGGPLHGVPKEIAPWWDAFEATAEDGSIHTYRVYDHIALHQSLDLEFPPKSDYRTPADIS